MMSEMEFVPGSLLEARDFNNEWFSAKVVEVDLEDREVLVHFQNWSSRYDEWISMDSARLRPVSQVPETSTSKASRSKDFKVGEKVMAVWNNNKKYPAQITKVLDAGNFEVIFYDGFVMQVKSKQISRLPKDQADKLEIPAAHPTEAEKERFVSMEEIGSKEERRKRKKKIEVATLFRYYKKRPSGEHVKMNPDAPDVQLNASSSLPNDNTSQAVVEEAPSTAISDKKKEKTINRDKETVKLNDAKLPAGWEKRARLKTCGTKAGKWDVVIIGPEGRTFRSRQDIKQYLFLHHLNYDLELFDFRLGEEFYRERGIEPPKRAKDDYVAPGVLRQFLKNEQPVAGPSVDSETPTFAPENDGYRCPLEDCRKLFRRDNLLLMHIKHYHPALLKKLGCKTLRVEDLATARTAFEADDIKPAIYTQSILSALLTPPPPSPTPAERKTEKLVESPILEDLLNVPLAKRVSSTNPAEGSLKPLFNTPIVTKSSRRRSDKINQSEHGEESVDDGVLAAIDAVVAGEDEIETEVESRKEEIPETPKTGDVTTLSVLEDNPGQKELVHCFCGSPEEDGLMIQCELCLCWQHGVCLGIDTEEGVPDPYVCHFCRYPYRERPSQRYTHDQTWLKKGNLPSLKFIDGERIHRGDKSLRIANTLTAAAIDLKQLLHSFRIKIDIAKNKDHHKLYLWAQPWKQTDMEPKTLDASAPDVQLDGPNSLVPNIPLPEAPINAIDCRLNLLSHIYDMQNEIDSRLDLLETLFEECEAEETVDASHMARMLQILLKDVCVLKRMASFTWNS